MSSANKKAVKEKDKKEVSKGTALPSISPQGKASGPNKGASSTTGKKVQSTDKANNTDKLPVIKAPENKSVKDNSLGEVVSEALALSIEAPDVPKVETTNPTETVVADINTQPLTVGDNPRPEAVAPKNLETNSIPNADVTPAVVVEEAPPEPKPPQNGKVTLIYEQYNEQFDIVNGSTTHENIDEVYCLSFVMPNCLIHLSEHNPQVKREMEAAGQLDLFIREEPRGTYHDLEVDKTYYVYVEQEADQLARDQARMKEIATRMEGAKSKDDTLGIVKDDGRVLESCSCIYGNPCVDEYGCKDWGNRFAIATKNGWKGF